MENKKNEYIRWQVAEFKKIERSRTWYILAGIFMLICIFFSFFTIENWHLSFLGYNSNFLFVFILIVAAGIMYINENRPPIEVTVELGPEGVKVGRHFYDYGEFKNFCVLYKPKMSIKNLYLEFKNGARPRLSFPLRRLEALTVRNFLVRYLEEDLEREAPPLSEQLTKRLKL